MEYNAKGQRKTILYGNLAQTKYTYDSLYRLLKATGREHYGQAQVGESDFPINTPVPFNNSSTSVENYTEQYEYDEIGNILKLIHQAGSGNWTRGYHYGTSNNRLLKTSLPGDTINDPGTYSATYTHDAHGNMTSMPHLSDMKWDFQDQLKEVDLGGGGTAYYVYSGGERVRKVIENGSLTKDRLYLDETNEYYREYISGSKDYERETLHVMDDRKRLAVVETKTYESGSPVGTPTTVIRYNFDNHLGSACLELDTSANIISYEEYHPFGTSSYRLGDSQAEVSLKRYRYVGKERDDETGLYYYGARYYAAWLCLFISVDALKDDYPYKSTYDYAENRPISGIDLDGYEYVTRIYNVNESGEVVHVKDIVYYQMSDEELKERGGKPKDDKRAAGYGPEGRGVKHLYRDSEGNEIEDRTRWDLRQRSFTGYFGNHGLYSGAGSITLFDKDNYDFSWQPIDRSDEIAKQHDIDYHNATFIEGIGTTYLGYTEDTRTLEADKEMLRQLDEFLEMVDPENNNGELTVAKETYLSAKRQKWFISMLAEYKEWKVSYMQEQGLDPDNPNDILEVLLSDKDVRKAFVNSAADKNEKKNRRKTLRWLRVSYSDPNEKVKSLENIKKLNW